MGKPFRRYEMLLPLRFNDGNPVPAELIADTLLELDSDSTSNDARRKPRAESGVAPASRISCETGG